MHDVGTNNLKKGIRSKELHKTTSEIIEEVEKKRATCRVAQAPPIYTTAEQNRECVRFNDLLEDTHEKIMINNDIIWSDRKYIDPEDGIHLTPSACKIMAQRIAEAVNTTPDIKEGSSITRTIHQDPEHSAEVAISAAYCGKVIGKGASTIKSIKAKHCVSINTVADGDKRTFVIKGKKADVEAARQEISFIVTQTKRKEAQPKQNAEEKPKEESHSRYRSACIFFNRGYCRNGRNCEFLHSKDHPVEMSPRTPARAPRSRDHSEERHPRDRSQENRRLTHSHN